MRSSVTGPPPPPGRLTPGSKCIVASQQECAKVGARYGTKYACVSCHKVFGKWSGYQQHVGGAPLTMIVAGVAADGSQLFTTGSSAGAPIRARPPTDAQGKGDRAGTSQAKAIKRLCQADDVGALLAEPTLGTSLAGRADLTAKVTATLVRRGRSPETNSLDLTPPSPSP
jgi:hypothetical protein